VQGIFFSRTVADLAVKHGLPSASVLRQFAQVGGLIRTAPMCPTSFGAVRPRTQDSAGHETFRVARRASDEV
jgi:hypothetical protein